MTAMTLLLTPDTLRGAVDSAMVQTFGETAVLFEPTAARCSSSSSTCCVLCVKVS